MICLFIITVLHLVPDITGFEPYGDLQANFTEVVPGEPLRGG